MFARTFTNIVSKAARRQAPVAQPARNFAADAHGHHDVEAKLFKPLSKELFYSFFGLISAGIIVQMIKKAAEPEVFPIYKAVLDEEVKIGKREADYQINPDYVPKLSSAVAKQAAVNTNTL